MWDMGAAVPLAVVEPAEASPPSKALLQLAFGLVVVGIAAWASALALQGSSLDTEQVRVVGACSLALTVAGLLIGNWAWRAWQQDAVANRVSAAQLNDFHAVMSQTNRLIL